MQLNSKSFGRVIGEPSIAFDSNVTLTGWEHGEFGDFWYNGKCMILASLKCGSTWMKNHVKKNPNLWTGIRFVFRPNKSNIFFDDIEVIHSKDRGVPQEELFNKFKQIITGETNTPVFIFTRTPVTSTISGIAEAISTLTLHNDVQKWFDNWGEKNPRDYKIMNALFKRIVKLKKLDQDQENISSSDILNITSFLKGSSYFHDTSTRNSTNKHFRKFLIHIITENFVKILSDGHVLTRPNLKALLLLMFRQQNNLSISNWKVVNLDYLKHSEKKQWLLKDYGFKFIRNPHFIHSKEPYREFIRELLADLPKEMQSSFVLAIERNAIDQSILYTFFKDNFLIDPNTTHKKVYSNTLF